MSWSVEVVPHLNIDRAARASIPLPTILPRTIRQLATVPLQVLIPYSPLRSWTLPNSLPARSFFKWPRTHRMGPLPPQGRWRFFCPATQPVRQFILVSRRSGRFSRRCRH